MGACLLQEGVDHITVLHRPLNMARERRVRNSNKDRRETSDIPLRGSQWAIAAHRRIRILVILHASEVIPLVLARV
jgi:hypothetical protein